MISRVTFLTFIVASLLEGACLVCGASKYEECGGNYPEGAAIAEHHRFRQPDALDFNFSSLFLFVSLSFPFFLLG
jgi:hypothetical protein